ncbi:hypothetical protein COCON_G00172680 [Conger conger]|uniref:Uncharacterized protein n=1 Tax=Conger conger TaxID=82655 RepID=A0A9Q1HUB7_CONCO|nr:serine/arginine repetitive matrix protein 1-like isoform X1 [Conger conger]KAJ8261545.1 hypothetical protein COCON_G00172680 [Conger conger]
MLCRVGGAWRRQAVTEAANAVLRRYGRRGWPPSHAPKPAHKPWRRGLQAGGAGPGPVVTDSGSSPEELSLLSRTFTVSSDPPSSRCAFPSPHPLPAPLLLPSRSSPQNRLSPRPAYLPHAPPPCPRGRLSLSLAPPSGRGAPVSLRPPAVSSVCAGGPSRDSRRSGRSRPHAPRWMSSLRSCTSAMCASPNLAGLSRASPPRSPVPWLLSPCPLSPLGFASGAGRQSPTPPSYRSCP